MGKLKSILLIAAVAALAACSGNDATLVNPGGGGGGGTTDVATLTLLASSPQLPSDNAAPITITALVRDASNNIVENVPVTFSASSGGLVVTQPAVTDASGILTATLSTAGDASNRSITVTSIADGTAQAAVTINVTGTAITINGPPSVPLGSSTPYTVVLTDAGGEGIAGVDIAVTSAQSNAIAPVVPATTITTNSSGEARFMLTGSGGGNDSITASALGAQFTKLVAVSTDLLEFTIPDPSSSQVFEIDLGIETLIQVSWPQGVGQLVSFTSSRGEFTDCNGTPEGSATVDVDGLASICVRATNAGAAVLTATNASDTSVQANVEFVATVPDTLELQASPFSLATEGQSSITAIVRDPDGNLVKNQTVNFVLTDITNGSLSTGQATTNSQGRAQTVYNASTTTSSVDGVRIDATVVSFPAVTDFVNLTVSQRELFISIGTGNEIDEPNTAIYTKEWGLFVTDAGGVGVNDADVTFSVLSTRYTDGFRELVGDAWTTTYPGGTFAASACNDEDTNRNGILDLVPDEDANDSEALEAGNIASVAPLNGSGGTVSTDANGFAILEVSWPQEYAYYLEVVLEVRTTVQGTEFSAATTFLLDGSATDFNNADISPPGPVSPFAGLCP
jgi:hypothetical protein